MVEIRRACARAQTTEVYWEPVQGFAYVIHLMFITVVTVQIPRWK